MEKEFDINGIMVGAEDHRLAGSAHVAFLRLVDDLRKPVDSAFR